VKGRITRIVEHDDTLAEVSVDAGGATVVSRVTQHSVHELALREGMPVYALIKAIALDRHSVGFA
jgi:molybdate transport system ATP-binding protein